MKTRAIALAVASVAVLIGASACTDTSVEPSSSIAGATAFSDPNSYRAFLAKVYAGLAVTGQQGAAGKPDLDPSFDEGFSQYVRVLWEAEELPTDEAVIGWNDTGLPELNTQVWATGNPFLNNIYNRIFFQIALANEFLRQTTDDKIPSDMKTIMKQYRAEARWLRALSYWHGIDLFGNIPLIKETDNFGANPPPQTSRTDLYNYVVSELTAIKPDLPAPSAAMYGRATKAAADMLLAKLYMNAQVYTGTAHYADAITALTSVMGAGYTLDSNWRHMFMADNNTSPELIFAVPMDGVHTQSWGGLTFLIHAACGGKVDNNSLGINGCWAGIRLKEQAYYNYTAGDKRTSFFSTDGQQIPVVQWDNGSQGVWAPKYTNMTSTGTPGQRGDFPDTDYPMFRLGDVYLMYAEAVLRGGGGSRATALQYVNAIRTRAGVPAWTDAQLTLDNILAERGRELLFEGHRRTDLVRYGKFTGGSYVWDLKNGTTPGTATAASHDLYPIPSTQMTANPKLTQNPGY